MSTRTSGFKEGISYATSFAELADVEQIVSARNRGVPPEDCCQPAFKEYIGPNRLLRGMAPRSVTAWLRGFADGVWSAHHEGLTGLKAHLVEAKTAALAAAERVEDLPGSSNFDHPVIHLSTEERRRFPRWHHTAVRLAITESGLEDSGRGGVLQSISRFDVGHANKRTAAAEAFVESLRRNGRTATVHYQAD